MASDFDSKDGVINPHMFSTCGRSQAEIEECFAERDRLRKEVERLRMIIVRRQNRDAILGDVEATDDRVIH